MSLTISTCFYIIKSKFDANVYIEWMNNFISIANQFNLVIYTDEKSLQYIETKGNPNIMIIIRPIESFYLYKFKEYWIENHKKNTLLNDRTEWKLNMLWSEKIWFVKETIERKYFDTDFYAWCDIGYFRNDKDDLNTTFLSNWCNPEKISRLKKDKIYYACINNDVRYINYLIKIINKKNIIGLPINEIPAIQTSVSGGFFIIHKDKIDWWSGTYENKLSLYFQNKYLVKDDQIILADCILTNENMCHFFLFKENVKRFNNWFMFQRILL